MKKSFNENRFFNAPTLQELFVFTSFWFFASGIHSFIILYTEQSFFQRENMYGNFFTILLGLAVLKMHVNYWRDRKGSKL